jgi:hypothetical protein
MIAGHAKHILDSQAGGAQQIGLKGDAVPVAGDHLEDRFGAGLMAATAAATDEIATPCELSGHVDGHQFAAQAFKAASVAAPVAVAPGAHSAVTIKSPDSIFFASLLSDFMQPCSPVGLR